MKNNLRLIIVASITLVCMLYIFPWQSFGVEPFVNIKPYRLGLDLHGGVELDYKVDFADTAALSGNIVNKGTVIEGLKSIIDKRANGLGLSDPTIQTAQYGDESHIIVQIPTQDYGNISDEEKVKKNAQDIVKAKETIGKVVKLEFKEEKKDITEADKTERKMIADKALTELKAGTDFATIGAKYSSQYENVGFVTSTGALPSEAQFTGYESITTFPYTTEVVQTRGPGSMKL